MLTRLVYRLAVLLARVQAAPWRGWLALPLGAASVLAFAPFMQGWLLFLLLPAFFLLLRSATDARQAALTGWLFGSGLFLAGVSWVYVSLSVFGGMPGWLAGPATVLFCLLLALYPALVGLVFYRSRQWLAPGRAGEILLFAALWTGSEGLRGWIFTGFPWLALGYSQTPPSPLAGFAPVWGVYGVSLLLCLAALLPWLRRTGWLVLAALLATGAGLQQLAWTQPHGEPLAVALLQGNIPQDMKWRPERFIATLRLYHDLMQAHPAQLTILPETAFPSYLNQIPPAYLERLRRLAQRQQGDVLFGVVTGEPAPDQAYWNSAVSLGQAPSQTYSKHHLVPFGESVPPGFAWFMRMAQVPMSQFSRGQADAPPLQLAGQPVAVNICYEDVFGEELRRSGTPATLLVNLSNTAWFGDSLAQAQHLQIARLRALELGRPMLRATNTGMTAVIRPDGTVQALLPPFRTAVLTARVQGWQGLTPYAHWGNVPVWLGIVLILLLVAGLSAWQQRQRGIREMRENGQDGTADGTGG